MSDRLSQLQDNVNYLASLFCDATGVLQEQAKPSKFENFADNLDRGYNNNQQLQQTDEIDHKATFTDLIITTTKEIDAIIDSLSNEDESTEEKQAEQLRKLEEENKEAAKELENVTKCAENLLKQIQQKLSQIAESELRMHYN